MDQDSDATNPYAPSESVVERVKRLNGVTWEWNDPDTHGYGRQMGVLAQEVEAVFPDLIRRLPDGTLTVDYHGFVAPLIEAVKELDARVASLEARLADAEAG